MAIPPVNVQHVQKFIQFAAKKLKLPSLPQIKLVGSQENKYDAFGHSVSNLIVVRISDRHPIDVMRSLCHELIHYRQNILGIKSSENTKEDQANLVAGRVMRAFDVSHPEVFKDKAIKANMMLESAIGATPVNVMGANAPNAGGGNIATFDPLFFKKKRAELGLIKNVMTPPKPLNTVLKRDIDTDKK